MIVPQDLKALVVDDNAHARAAMSATLKKLGLAEIDEHAAAAPVVNALLGQSYDIMFMDWYMPEMNGAALLEILRGTHFPANRRPPVVMVTAYPNRDTFARARELGVGEILVKPFTVAQVAATLQKLLPGGWGIEDDDDGAQVLL